MLSTKLEEFIQKTYPSDLIIWMNQNPNLIYHSEDALMSKMRKLEFTNTSSYNINSIDKDGCIGLLNALFYKKESVTEVEFNLLEATAFSLLVKSEVPFTVEDIAETPLLSLLTFFLSPYDIINDSSIYNFNLESSKYIYMDIMNIFIPCEDAIKFVEEFHKTFSFKEILENASNTNWFIKRYKESSLSSQFSQKDMLLLFKYISDIYTNKEQKLDYFFRLHRYYHHSYAYNQIFNTIADRYEKYFKDDTRYIICELLDLASSDSLTDDVETFLMTWSKEYSTRANNAVMKCFINDISTLLQFIPSYSSTSISNMTKMNDVISKMWGMPKYNVEGHSYEKEILFDDDKPISFLESINQEIATEALHKDSVKMNNAGKKIYKAYRAYKDAEEKVDSQISKAVSGMKKVLVGDVRTEIIEGKSFSAIGLLKKYLGTVAIFSFGPIKGAIALVVKYALKKKTTTSERRKIIMELETEIELITEKIEDARGDGNREAKYAMMRTKKELEHALTRIKYGMEADRKSVSGAKALLNSAQNGDYV